MSKYFLFFADTLFKIPELGFLQDRKCEYKVTPWRVRVTFVAMEKK
jgi:hypothetical protein